MTRTVKRQSQPRTRGEEPGRRIGIRLAYLMLAVLLALFAYAFLRKMGQVQRLQQQAAALQQQNNQTAQENASLQRSIRYYRTPQYVQDEARALLGDTLPGEVSIVSRPTHPRYVPAPRPAPMVVPTPLPSWQQWWNAFAH